MNIQLKGYFDKNLGDDIMQLIAVKGMPEHEFYAAGAQREMLAHLEGMENFHIGSAPSPAALVSVTGTGFMYNGRLARLSRLVELLTSKPARYGAKAVVGCSIEPVKGCMSALFTRRELNACGYISCRDAPSYEYIKKHTGKAEVRFYPDIAFSMADELAAVKKTHSYLGIIPVRRMYADVNYDYYRSLAAAADAYPGPVMLIAFDNGLENDASACLSIMKLMKKKAELFVYNSDPMEAVRCVADCERLVTSRFHGAVIGAMLGLPVYSVCDAMKLKLLSRELGIGYSERGDAEGLMRFVTEPQTGIRLSSAIGAEAKKHITELKLWLERV